MDRAILRLPRDPRILRPCSLWRSGLRRCGLRSCPAGRSGLLRGLRLTDGEVRDAEVVEGVRAFRIQFERFPQDADRLSGAAREKEGGASDRRGPPILRITLRGRMEGVRRGLVTARPQQGET